MKTERALGPKEGLPGRPWYRHQIYAPGFYTGYGVKTLPAVREAIEQREWKKVAGNRGGRWRARSRATPRRSTGLRRCWAGSRSGRT